LKLIIYDLFVLVQLRLRHGYQIDVAHCVIEGLGVLLVNVVLFLIPLAAVQEGAVDIAAVFGRDVDVKLARVLGDAEEVEGEGVDRDFILLANELPFWRNSGRLRSGRTG